MRALSVGGGPAGLYFGLLAKRADPSREITVRERNGPDDTFGFGVVFSDRSLQTLHDEDAETSEAIAGALVRWDTIQLRPRRGGGLSVRLVTFRTTPLSPQWLQGRVRAAHRRSSSHRARRSPPPSKASASA